MEGPEIQLDRRAIGDRLALRPRRQWAALLRELEVDGVAPPRSTFYLWAKEWEARTPPASAQWSVMTDETGRPEVVLTVVAALNGASAGRLSAVSTDEAELIARLVIAKPTLLAHENAFSPAGLAPWLWAQRYRRAAPDELAALDLELALL